MRTVYKYPVEPAGNGWFELELPGAAVPVLVAAQMGRVRVWFQVDTEMPVQTRRFQLVPTGGPIAPGMRHIQSFLTNNGAYVWHLYEEAK